LQGEGRQHRPGEPKAQSASSTPGEYQSTRVKLHVDENGLSMLRLMESAGTVRQGVALKQAANTKPHQEI